MRILMTLALPRLRSHHWRARSSMTVTHHSLRASPRTAGVALRAPVRSFGGASPIPSGHRSAADALSDLHVSATLSTKMVGGTSKDVRPRHSYGRARTATLVRSWVRRRRKTLCSSALSGKTCALDEDGRHDRPAAFFGTHRHRCGALAALNGLGTGKASVQKADAPVKGGV